MRQESGGNELRIKSLTEELNALRAALAERESIISQIRSELSESSMKIQKATSMVHIEVVNYWQKFKLDVHECVHLNVYPYYTRTHRN